MKAYNKYKQIILGLSILMLGSSCVDILPDIEDLPSPDVSFEYLVKDNTYQLDYYVGANIEIGRASCRGRV